MESKVTFENNVEQFLRDTDEKTLDMFKEVADLLVKNIRAEAPVITGALRDATEAEVHSDGITVYNSKDYAPYVEMGTSRQSANPFMRRGITKSITQLDTLAKRELGV